MPQAHHSRHLPRRLQGAALMVMLVIVVLGIAAVLTGSLSASARQSARQKNTAAALAQAKEALIGYAITYGDSHSAEVHGYLPCPDINGLNVSGNPAEGSARASCGPKDVSTIGRLPWRTLGLPALRDGDNECLWYAVSGSYKNNSKTSLMNWDTNGKLQVFASDGTLLGPQGGQVVAAIIAPGAAQAGQNRSGNSAPLCGGNYTAANYLDSDTVHTIDNANIAAEKFMQAHEDRDANGSIILTVNDQLIFITQDDIFHALERRNNFLATLKQLTQKVAECIADFGKKNKIGGVPDTANKSLPWPAPLSLADYGDNADYNDKSGLYAGRVPYQVDSARLKTGNAIASDYLLTSGGNNCPASANWTTLYPWWDNWKDHLFYALSKDYAPQSAATTPCGNCVAVNGTPYAAVVIFAGAKLSALNQTRADKSTVADFLESVNASNFSAANGSEQYKTVSASSTFNDVLYCIDQNLAVAVCP